MRLRCAPAPSFTLALLLFGVTACDASTEPLDDQAGQTDEEEDSVDVEAARRPWWQLEDGGSRIPEWLRPRRDAGTTTPVRDAGAVIDAEVDEGDAEVEPPVRTDAGKADAGKTDAGHTTGDAGHAGTDEDAELAACLHGKRDARDSQLGDEPQTITVGTARDLIMPAIVLDWMKEREWDEAHNGWHLIRTWDQSCRKSNATETTCNGTKRLAAQGLWRSPHQQGSVGEGWDFLGAHRHLILLIRDAFPSHPKLFSGFKHVPKTRDDPENTTPWRNLSWSANAQRGIEILDNIEQNLAMFPTDDDLGNYIESSFRWTPENPSVPANKPGSAMHGQLHGQWNVFGSPRALINQAVDMGNYNFWKLHGWIDDVWERYRKAKGLDDSEPMYRKVMLEQCREMHDLMPSNRKKPTNPGDGGVTNPGDGGVTNPGAETGYFAKNVRPALELVCAGCHSHEGGASGGLVLGGDSSSTAELLADIVSVKSSNGIYDLVVPGDPDKSWIYLKAANRASTAPLCTATKCDRGQMPPAGAGLSTVQLAALRQWITDGAKTN